MWALNVFNSIKIIQYYHAKENTEISISEKRPLMFLSV